MQDLPQERLMENTKPLPLPAAKQLPESASLRQGAELALKGNWFRSAFEHAAIGMALADLDDRCLTANRSLCEMLGYTEVELLGIEFLSLVHPDDREVNLRCRRQLLAGKIPAFTIGRRYFHKRGHVVWTLLSVSLARDAQGRPLYIISQVQDVTEHQRQNAALRELEKTSLTWPRPRIASAR